MKNGISILDNNVSITNLAVRSAHGFTLREKRLFVCGLSKLDSFKKIRSVSIADRTFTVTAEDYAEIAGTDLSDAYADLIAACENIRKRYLRYSIQTPRGIKERTLNWVTSLTYHRGEGWVAFTLNEEIIPHVFGLVKRFTSYRLRQASELRSVYSWRILELLISHTNDDSKEHTETLTLDSLRHGLELPKSYRYDHIKKRVIEPAVKELTQKDGWIIDWKPIKKGRSVESINFTYKRTLPDGIYGREMMEF